MSDSNPTFEALFEAANDAVILVGRNGGSWKVEGMNPAARGWLLPVGSADHADSELERLLDRLVLLDDKAAILSGLESGEEDIGGVRLERNQGNLTAGIRIRRISGDPDACMILLQPELSMADVRTWKKEVRDSLAQILRHIHDAVILVDGSGEVEYVNREAERLTGWPLDEITGESVELAFRLVDSHSRDPIPSPVKYAAQTGLPYRVTEGCHLLQRKGESIPIQFLATPVEDSTESGSPGILVVFRDDTPGIRLQEVQTQSQHLESVNHLAGGIAHDFNNILTGILGHLSLMQENGDPAWAAKIEGVLKAANRAKGLSSQLLSLAKGHAPVLKAASSRELLLEVAQFSLTGSNSKLDMDLPADLWSCLMDEGQIAQVLNNLLINAKQALEGGGTIWIRGKNTEVVAEDGLPVKPGIYVRIDIEDTGPGIAPGHLSRIFDPYFTTKTEGSGLGLANCKTIVRQHQGHLSVESVLGQGSVFSLYLPATKAAPVEPVTTEEAPTIYHGKGRVLVMDDEALVQEIAIDILKHLGYEPEVAANGEEALEKVLAAQKENQPFAAVIVDLTVPGSMGGLDTKKRMEVIAPEIPVIVSSGYSNDPVLVNYHENGFVGVALKPYTIQQFSTVLKDAILRPGRGKEGSRRSNTAQPFHL